MSSSIIELTRLSSDIVESDNDVIVDLEKVIDHDTLSEESDNTADGIRDVLFDHLGLFSDDDDRDMVIDVILWSTLTLDREMIQNAMDDVKYEGETHKEEYELLAKTFYDDEDLRYDLYEFTRKIIEESVKASYQNVVKDLLLSGIKEGVDMTLLTNMNTELSDFSALGSVKIHENMAHKIYDMQLGYTTTTRTHNSLYSYITSLDGSDLTKRLIARSAMNNASTDTTDEEVKIDDMVDKVCVGLSYDEDNVEGEVSSLLSNNAELRDEFANLLARFPSSLLTSYAIPKPSDIDHSSDNRSVFLSGLTVSALETLMHANPFEFQKELHLLDNQLKEALTKKNIVNDLYVDWSGLMLYALRRGEHDKFAAFGDTLMAKMTDDKKTEFIDKLKSHFSKHSTAILKDAPIFTAWLEKYDALDNDFALTLSMMIDYNNEESVELYTSMIREMVVCEEKRKGVDREAADLFGYDKLYIGNFSKALFLHAINNAAAWKESKLLLTEKLPDITEAILSELSREEIDDMLTVAIYNKIQCDDDRHFTALTTALSEHANVNMSNVISSLFDLAPMLDELTDPTKAFGSFSSWISTSQRLPAVHRDNYMHLAESFYALVEHMRSERHSLDAGDITNAAILMDQIESNKKLDKLLEGEEEAPAQVRHQFTL